MQPGSIYYHHLKLRRSSGPIVAALGNFDGVHLGHQSLLATCRQRAGHSGRVAVLSFFPHPAEVLGRVQRLGLLTPIGLKADLLRRAGVDDCILFRFNRVLSSLSAEHFIEKLLIERLDVATLVVGPDARVGSGAQGGPELILSVLHRHGRSGEVVPFLNLGEERVSSRRIRELLSAGNVNAACALLGRPFAIVGHVRPGAQRGRQIGFRTMNLPVGRYHVPRDGVYATRVILGGQEYQAVTNIGVRPTFGARERGIETHLLDFTGGGREAYGMKIVVEFIERIREEMRFSGAEELTAQIALDIACARELLSRPMAPSPFRSTGVKS